MTEERLTEILIEHRVCERMANGRTFVVPSALEAMKQVVNEALDEVVANTDQFDHIHKDEILNLKVK